MFDGDAFGQQMVEIVRGYVDGATAPLLARIDALEKRELVLPEKGVPGEPGQPGEKGEPGVVDMEAVKALIDEAVAALPPAERGEKGEPGEPGTIIDMEEVASRIDMAVKSAVAALPAPKDGEPGLNGVGLSDALKDAEGNLVLVMADGRTKNLGPIDGKDGAPGETFTLDDFDVVPLDERSIKLCFTKGEVMHSFELAFPLPIYRNVFKDTETYDRGDLVTWAGAMWHSEKDGNTDKPGTGDSWTLAVKKGRDGKDAGK